MKATSRKRLLISSVAMLLVAMLALGTATFAWFTQDTKASAQGVKMKVTSANGLKILTESHAAAEQNAAYVKNDLLRYTKDGNNPAVSNPVAMQMTPASMTVAVASGNNNGTLSANAYTTKAASDGAYDADPKAAVTTATAGYNAQQTYKENIYCKLVGSSDAAATDTVSIDSINVSWQDTSTITDGTQVQAMQEAMRMIVTYTDVSANTTKVVGAYSKVAVSNEKTLNGVIDAVAADNSDVATKGYAHVAASTSNFTVFPNSSVELGTVDTTGNDYVTVYIYLDGEDDDVFTNNIPMSDLISSVTVNLSITGEM